MLPGDDDRTVITTRGAAQRGRLMVRPICCATTMTGRVVVDDLTDTHHPPYVRPPQGSSHRCSSEMGGASEPAESDLRLSQHRMSCSGSDAQPAGYSFALAMQNRGLVARPVVTTGHVHLSCCAFRFHEWGAPSGRCRPGASPSPRSTAEESATRIRVGDKRQLVTVVGT